jgi:hypothetical protein
VKTKQITLKVVFMSLIFIAYSDLSEAQNAQSKPAAVAKPAKKNVVYRKTQEVSFEGSDVDGVARNPDGAFVHQKKTAKFFPLFKVHQNFENEILKSVDYIE